MFRDKIEYLLSNKDIVSIRTLLFAYLDVYSDEFKTMDILDLMNDLNSEYLRPGILKDNHALCVAKERGTYLKAYLEGAMYSSKEAAEQHVGIQIRHADAIIQACKGEEI